MGDRPLDTILHLGAHKTASTHFNLMVRDSAAASDATGLYEVPQGQFRPHVTWRLSDPEGETSADPHALRRSLLPTGANGAGIARLFISDENVIGITERLLDGGQMYPRAVSRVQRMLHMLGPSDLRCLLSIRNPAQFVTSAYGESVRSGSYADSATYLGDTPLEALRWAPIVAALAEALDGVPLTVWPYEEYHAVLPDLLTLCLGDLTDGPVTMAGPQEIVRPGLSQHALNILREEGRACGTALPSARVQEVMRRYPKSETYPGPKVFDTEAHAQLTERYNADLALIGEMPGVTLLSAATAR